MEYLKLFQAVCSEIDVVGKALASIVDSSFKPTKDSGINEWWYRCGQRIGRWKLNPLLSHSP